MQPQNYFYSGVLKLRGCVLILFYSLNARAHHYATQHRDDMHWITACESYPGYEPHLTLYGSIFFVYSSLSRSIKFEEKD